MRVFLPVLFLTLALYVSCKKEQDPYSFKEESLLKLINQHREEIGLQPLQMNEFIYTKAKEHAENMAKGLVTYSHEGYFDRYNQIKEHIPNVTGGGENILYGPDTPEAVLEAWLLSTDHKKNIEGDFNLTGLAMVKDKDGNYFYTQIFIRKE